MNIQEAVDHCTSVLEGRKVESPRLSAELLVAHVTGLSRAQIFSHPDQVLTPLEESSLSAVLLRRSRHEPVPYITGEVEFYSIPLTLTNGVLVPRPETETLVEATLALARKMHFPKIYDVATGSGNIIIALALNLDDGEFWASDISNTAIQVAMQNLRRHELEAIVQLREGSLFAPIRNELNKDFDIIVTNPPYVKSTDIPKLSPQIRDFEPHLALDGGRDGLTIIRSILDGAAPILKSGGYVLLEADPSEMKSIRIEVRHHSVYTDFVVLNDMAGRERVCQFQKK